MTNTDPISHPKSTQLFLLQLAQKDNDKHDPDLGKCTCWRIIYRILLIPEAAIVSQSSNTQHGLVPSPHLVDQLSH